MKIDFFLDSADTDGPTSYPVVEHGMRSDTDLVYSGVAMVHELFDAIECGVTARLEALVSADCVMWQNYRDAESAFAEMIPKLAAFRASLAELRYADRAYVESPGGAIGTHRLCGRRKDGDIVEIPVAVRITSEDGKIASIAEYLDPAALGPLFAPSESGSGSR